MDYKSITLPPKPMVLVHLTYYFYAFNYVTCWEMVFICIYKAMKLVPNPTQTLTLTFGSSATYC